MDPADACVGEVQRDTHTKDLFMKDKIEVTVLVVLMNPVNCELRKLSSVSGAAKTQTFHAKVNYNYLCSFIHL